MDATFSKRDELYVLALERQLAHPPEKVWRVLTEKDLLAQWFPCDIKGEWLVGAKLQFEFRHGEGDDLPEEQLRGEVLTVEPERLLEFRWGHHTIRCELIPRGETTTLRFSETLDDPSWGARNAAGWEMCLDNLELAIQAGTIAKFGWEVWKAKFQHYTNKFEPEHGPQDDPSQNVRDDVETADPEPAAD